MQTETRDRCSRGKDAAGKTQFKTKVLSSAARVEAERMTAMYRMETVGLLPQHCGGKILGNLIYMKDEKALGKNKYVSNKRNFKIVQFHLQSQNLRISYHLVQLQATAILEQIIKMNFKE